MGIVAACRRRCDDVRAVVDAWDMADEGKLAELILYVAERVKDDPTGGATKINKILYFAEFAHIRDQGVPITGAPYQKLPRGPAPRRLRPIRDQLIANGDAVLETHSYFGYPQYRLIPQRDADANRFSDSERQAVEQVIKALWGKTANDVSELSHLEKGWELVELYEDIPFATAFLARESIVTDSAREHAAQLAEKLGLRR